MQLRAARLCLDCEEVHDANRCPVCASDSFAYLSRWVPVEERHLDGRPRPAPAEKKSARSRWVASSAIGLGAFALGRWLLRPPAKPEGRDAPKGPEGE